MIVSLATALRVAPTELTEFAVAPPGEPATEVAVDEVRRATRTGEADAWWFGFGPTNIGTWEMAVALEDGDQARAVAVAERLHPEHIPSPQRRAAYWADYGRALTPVHRHPFARQAVVELLGRVRCDAVGRELRGIAYRAGLTG